MKRLITLMALLASGLAAQDIELYLLSGANDHGGVVIKLQSTVLRSQWRPQFGGGALVPVSRNWAGLVDVTTSAIEQNWKWDGASGVGPSDNLIHLRRLSAMPSVVRLWRRSRYKVYIGAGVSVEHQREKNRYRVILGRETVSPFSPILGRSYMWDQYNTNHLSPALRAGVSINLTNRIVLRTGYTRLLRYTDAPQANQVEFGIGYRFARR